MLHHPWFTENEWQLQPTTDRIIAKFVVIIQQLYSIVEETFLHSYFSTKSPLSPAMSHFKAPITDINYKKTALSLSRNSEGFYGIFCTIISIVFPL